MSAFKLVATICVALCGCASGGYGLMDGIMSSWAGASTDDVIKQWGYPHDERVIAGKRLLVWNREVQLTLPATASTTGSVNRVGNTSYYTGTTTVSGGGASNWSCTRILEIDSNNRVIGWQWEGNNCPFMDVAAPYNNWRRKSGAP